MTKHYSKKSIQEQYQKKAFGDIITSVWLTKQIPYAYAKLIILIKSMEDYETFQNPLTIPFVFMFDVNENDKILEYVLTCIKMDKISYDQKIFSYYLRKALEIRVQEENSLRFIAATCELLPYYVKKKKLTANDSLLMGYILTNRAYEAIGYWTAKLEEMIRNKTSVIKSRTALKEKRKAQLIEWMKTMKPKDYRIKGQTEWNVVDRTVLLYEQEINAGEKPRNEQKKFRLVTEQMNQELWQELERDKNRVEELKRNPKLKEEEIKKYETLMKKRGFEETVFLRKNRDNA